MNISTDEDPAIVHNKSGNRSYLTPVTFDLNRSKEDVTLVVENGSEEAEVVLRS